VKTGSFVHVFAALLTITACNPFAPDQTVELGVSKLEAPSTVSSGNSFNVVLTVTVGGCTRFDHISMQRDLSGATLTAWGENAAKGRKDVVCPQDIVEEPHSFELFPPYASTFTVTVGRGRVSPLQATVQVQ
jgi:hypothetical protein